MTIDPKIHAELVAEYAATKDHEAYLAARSEAKKAQAIAYAQSLHPKKEKDAR